MTLAAAPIDFDLPAGNIATLPAEHQSRSRDSVRLMVVERAAGSIRHKNFVDLPDHLMPGDALVVNASRTIPAALRATTPTGSELLLHISSPASGGLWSVEVRQLRPGGGSYRGPEVNQRSLSIPGGHTAQLLAREPHSQRLWIAAVDVDDMAEYLAEHGRPIRYEPGPELAIDEYQTVFAHEPGSAEMPSAGRPFTEHLVTRLVSMGVLVVPVVLHAGVSSFEAGETPGAERFEVSPSTATALNALRRAGGRVIAVGTTVVRALETVADPNGEVHPGQGFTDLVVTSHRSIRAVDGLITGWHEPRSSHLNLLEAFLDRSLLANAYERAVSEGYLWHEFGDSMLILP